MKLCRRTGMIRYRSVGEARAVAQQILGKESMARYYERLQRERSAFKCPYCPSWHLTSLYQDDPATGVNFDDPA